MAKLNQTIAHQLIRARSIRTEDVFPVQVIYTPYGEYRYFVFAPSEHIVAAVRQKIDSLDPWALMQLIWFAGIDLSLGSKESSNTGDFLDRRQLVRNIAVATVLETLRHEVPKPIIENV